MSAAGESSRAALTPVAAGVAAAGFALLAPATARAYLEVVPDIQAGAIHETNVFNRPDDEEDATGAFIDLRLPTTWRGTRDELRLVPRARFTEYTDSDQGLNRDDYYLGADWSHTALRSEWGLGLRFEDTDVRSSEFVSATPEDPDAEPIPDDTGFGRFIFADDRRQLWSVDPFLEHQFTERNTVSVGASLSEVEYDPENEENRRYFDYEVRSAQLGLSHIVDLQSALTLRLTASEFDAESPVGNNSNLTESRSLLVGYQRNITPTWTGTANVGVTRSTIRLSGSGFFSSEVPGENCAATECVTSDDNFVGDLSLRKRSERTTFNFGISRAATPRSNGTEVLRTSYNFFVNRQLARRLSASLGAVYIEESNLGDVLFSLGTAQLSEEREYFTVDLTGRWQFARQWWLYGTYTYRSDEYDVELDGVGIGGEDRVNNRFFVGIQYRGVGWRR